MNEIHETIMRKQFERMSADDIFHFISDVQARVGSHVVQSEIINQDYLDDQRALAQLAGEYL